MSISSVMKSLYLILFLCSCVQDSNQLETLTHRYHVSNVSITVGLQDPFTGLYWDGTTAADSSAPDLYLGDENGKPLFPPFWTANNETHVVWPLAGPEDLWFVDVIKEDEIRVDIFDQDDNGPQWVWGCSADPFTLDPRSHILNCSAYDMDLSATIIYPSIL